MCMEARLCQSILYSQEMSRGKWTNSLAVLLLLFTVLVLSGATKKNSTSTCALQCEVPPGLKSKTAKCSLSADSWKLNCSSEAYSNILRNVFSLDLSDNRLTKVPTWMFPYCESLTILSLSKNKIKEIECEAFKDLGNLKLLNLSFNDLREWKVNPNHELQSLNYVDVTGNEHRFPGNELLIQLNSLLTVRGVKISEHCQNCSLLKLKANAATVNSTSEWWCYKRSSLPNKWLWHDQIQYGKALDFIKAGFWPTCLCDHACFTSQSELPLFRAISGVTKTGLVFLYATGSVVLIVNIIVILVILCHKSLRGDLSVCLILDIAVCDVIIGIFVILFAYLHPNFVYIRHLYDVLEGSRYDLKVIRGTANIMGPILTCAVAAQVFGSFIVTLEKFCKIVFSTRPEIRIGKRCVIPFLFIAWSLSVIYAILPTFNVGRMTYFNGFVGNTPLPTDQLFHSEKKSVGIAAAFQIVLLVTQLTSFILYLPIFIVAKRSGANVGIKREATIARKIALLVFTNLIFFTVPVVLSVFQQKMWQVMQDNWREHTISEFQWVGFCLSVLPVLCLSINSILNPFLYAFRHPKIKQQLEPIVSRCRTALSECFVHLRQHLHCHSNAVQPENDMEMQAPGYSKHD